MQLIPKQVLVLGAGAFGTALAIHLSRCALDVALYSHSEQHIEQMQRDNENKSYLPSFKLSDITFISSLHQYFANADQVLVLIVVPSIAFESVLEQLQPYQKKFFGILWGTKGLGQNSEFLHDLCHSKFPNLPKGILAGPSFAREVALGMPTAVTLATDNEQFGQMCVQAIHKDVFRIYLSSDLTGVALGGVIKNVLAIAVGMCDGLGFGANARAALVTRGLTECQRLGEPLGMQLSTLLGMACIGDVVLTCTDNQSRNRRFGVYIGQGLSVAQAESAVGHVVEGKANVRQLVLLASKFKVDLPICRAVHQVLVDSKRPQDVISSLLSRSPKREASK